MLGMTERGDGDMMQEQGVWMDGCITDVHSKSGQSKWHVHKLKDVLTRRSLEYSAELKIA